MKIKEWGKIRSNDFFYLKGVAKFIKGLVNGPCSR